MNKLNILIASVYFGEIQQAWPMFAESIKNLDPVPKKTVVFDLVEQRELDQPLVEGLIEIRHATREKDLMAQVTSFRNQILLEAKNENFDAVFFIQPNIFAPPDVLQRLFDSGKECIAPAFYSNYSGVIHSNAMKKTRQGLNEKANLDMVLFDELLPSGIKEVFGVSLETVFLRKPVFGKIEFPQTETALSEMIAFHEQIKKLGKKIFIDSGTVCSKLGPTQLMSYYYFKAQNAAEKPPE